MKVFSSFDTAKKLPDGWDKVCKNNPFLKREFLKLLEECNPCGQRYYYMDNITGSSLFVTYEHRLNILTYGLGSWSMNVTIVGVPCSVSKPGFIVNTVSLSSFKKALTDIQGGVLLLNSPVVDLDLVCARSTTLPNCVLQTTSKSFTQYLESMRSHYRYKLNRSMKRFDGVRADVLADNSVFSEEYYQLYEQVYNRSRYKLEKLPIDFFRKSDSDITLFEKNGHPLGFCQTTFSDNRLFYLFGGVDYASNTIFDTYFNILLYIVRKGLNTRVEGIDLGQTAEEVKLRLGCKTVPQYLFARHSNPFINAGIRKCITLLGYNGRVPGLRVFKKGCA